MSDSIRVYQHDAALELSDEAIEEFASQLLDEVADLDSSWMLGICDNLHPELNIYYLYIRSAESGLYLFMTDSESKIMQVVRTLYPNYAARVAQHIELKVAPPVVCKKHLVN